MSNPLVSIIVPVYNAEKTAAYCLESICGQTYPALEILVLNDGSADGSLAVCRQLAAQDPRIRVIDKPKARSRKFCVPLWFRGVKCAVGTPRYL